VNAVRIFVFLTAVPLLMKLRLDRVRLLVSKPVPPCDADPERIAHTIRLVDLMLRFGRPVVARSCVTRGLTLYYFLRKLGVDVELVFGAGHVSDRFAAHCWLERGSEPYLEKVNPRGVFVPFYRFGSIE
jgi:hypothetical protein